MAEQNVQYQLQTFNRLRDMQREGILCDLILISKDGSEFRVHASVIVAASQSFYTLLLQKGSLKKIRLRNINGTSLALLIRFIYGEQFSSSEELMTLLQALSKLGMKDLFRFVEQLYEPVDKSTSCGHVQSGNTTHTKANGIPESNKPFITVNKCDDTKGNASVSKGNNAGSVTTRSDNSADCDYRRIKSEPVPPNSNDNKSNYNCPRDGPIPNDVKTEIDSHEHPNSGNHSNNGNNICEQQQQHRELEEVGVETGSGHCVETGSGHCVETGSGHCVETGSGHCVETGSMEQLDGMCFTDDSYVLPASYQQHLKGLRPVGLFKNESLPTIDASPSTDVVNLDNQDKLSGCLDHPQVTLPRYPPAANVHDKLGVNPVTSPKKNNDDIHKGIGTDCLVLLNSTVTSQKCSSSKTHSDAVACADRNRYVLPKSSVGEDLQKRCQDVCQSQRVQVLLRPVDNHGNYAIFPASSDRSCAYLNTLNLIQRSLDKYELEPPIPEKTRKKPAQKDEISSDNSGIDERHLGKEPPPSYAGQTPVSSVAVVTTSSQPKTAQHPCSVATTQTTSISVTPTREMIAFPAHLSNSHKTGSHSKGFSKTSTYPFLGKCNKVKNPNIRNILPLANKTLSELGTATEDAKSHIYSEPVHDCASKRMKMLSKLARRLNEEDSRTMIDAYTTPCEPGKTTGVSNTPIGCDEVVGNFEEIVGKSEVVPKTGKRNSSEHGILRKYSSKKLKRGSDSTCGTVDGNEILVIDLDTYAVESACTDTEKTVDNSNDEHVTHTADPESDNKSSSSDGPSPTDLEECAMNCHLLPSTRLKKKAKFHVYAEMELDHPAITSKYHKTKEIASERPGPKQQQTNFKMKPQINNEIKPRTSIQMKPQTNIEIEPQTNTKIKPQTNIKMQLQTKIKIKPQTNIEMKPQINNEIKPRTSIQMKPQTNIEFKSQTNIKMKPQTNIEIEPQTNIEMKPQIEIKIKPQTNIEMKPQTNIEMKPRTNIEIKPQTNIEMKSQTNIDFKPQTNIKMKAQANIEVKPQANIAIKPEPNTVAILQKTHLGSQLALPSSAGQALQLQVSPALLGGQPPVLSPVSPSKSVFIKMPDGGLQKVMMLAGNTVLKHLPASSRVVNGPQFTPVQSQVVLQLSTPAPTATRCMSSGNLLAGRPQMLMPNYVNQPTSGPIGMVVIPGNGQFPEQQIIQTHNQPMPVSNFPVSSMPLHILSAGQSGTCHFPQQIPSRQGIPVQLVRTSLGKNSTAASVTGQVSEPASLEGHQSEGKWIMAAMPL